MVKASKQQVGGTYDYTSTVVWIHVKVFFFFKWRQRIAKRVVVVTIESLVQAWALERLGKKN